MVDRRWAARAIAAGLAALLTAAAPAARAAPSAGPPAVSAAAAAPAAAVDEAGAITPAPAATLPLRSFGRTGGAGLSRFGVREDNVDLRLGFFLGGAAAAFAEVPAAREHAARAGAAKRLGFGFWTAGLTLLVGDLVLALAAGDRIDYAGASGAPFWGLLGGSIVANLVAQDRLLHADGELAEATRLWNEAAFARARGTPLVGRAGFEPATR